MRVFFTFFFTLVFSVALILAFPELTINPGKISVGHQEFHKDCLKCHTPLSGATDEKCISCHELDQIGILTTTGKPILDNGKAKVQFHQSLTNSDCKSCHILHSVIGQDKEPVRFQHDFLTASMRNECSSCHEKNRPADDLHRNTKDNCGTCHTTKAWEPATFDHKKLSAQASCIPCHQKEKPTDDIHLNTTENCVTCHSTEAWEPATFDHKKLSSQTSCATCHQKKRPTDDLHFNTKDDCGTCHTTKAWEPATFDHKKLSAQAGCVPCHQKELPSDDLHRSTKENCITCHTTEAWKPATFDHKKLSAQAGCVPCHQKERPNDDLHANAKENCSACHSTNAWKPATFDHDKYFVFDRNHPSKCVTCHTKPNAYKEYTCYGCHEHSQAGIASEHQEEGIYNFEKCVRCHRSGNEDDAKRHYD